MIKALLLIFDPARTWDRILENRRGVVAVLGLFLLPLLVLTAAVEAFFLHLRGRAMLGTMTQAKPLATNEVVVFASIQLVLSLAVVFVGAWLLKSLGQTFHSRHTFQQAFTAVAYSLSPLFLLRLGNACSFWSPWVPWLAWAVGIALSLGVLYHGVPKALEPDPPQAFGVFLSSALLLLVITGLERLITFGILQERFPALKALTP